MKKKILFEKEGKKKPTEKQQCIQNTGEKKNDRREGKKITEIYVKRLSFDYWTMEKVFNVHVTIASWYFKSSRVF